MIINDLSTITTLHGHFIGTGTLDFEHDLGGGQMMRVSIDLPSARPPGVHPMDDETLSDYFPKLMDAALRSLYFQVREESKVRYYCTLAHRADWKTRRDKVAESAKSESLKRTHCNVHMRRGAPRKPLTEVFDQVDAGKSLADAAAAIGVSERGLQKRLESNGFKYSKLRRT